MKSWRDKSVSELNCALGIPVNDSCPGEALGTHLGVAVDMARHGLVSIFTPLGLSPHDRARIEIIEGAMEHGCDLLMFVDDDTLVPALGFSALLQAMRESGSPLVSGHYSRRGYPYTCVWSKKVVVDGKSDWVQVDSAEGLHEIDTTGLGCALIDVQWVREKLRPPYFEMGHDGRATLVLDDVSFCEKVRKAGGTVLGHAGVRCGHLGQRTVIDDSTRDYLRARLLRSE